MTGSGRRAIYARKIYGGRSWPSLHPHHKTRRSNCCKSYNGVTLTLTLCRGSARFAWGIAIMAGMHVIVNWKEY